MKQFYDADGIEREFHETIQGSIEMSNLIQYIQELQEELEIEKDFEVTVTLHNDNEHADNESLEEDELLEEDSCESQDE